MKIVILSYVYLPNSFAIILSYVYIPNSYSLPVVSPMETVILSSFSTMICIAFPLILEFDTVMLLFYQWPRCYERNTVTAFNDNDTFYSKRCICFFGVCFNSNLCFYIWFQLIWSPIYVTSDNYRISYWRYCLLYKRVKYLCFYDHYHTTGNPAITSDVIVYVTTSLSLGAY